MVIQLQDLAKQVLFGTTLEEKLSIPREEVIDTQTGSAIAAPATLTRPEHLKLRENGVRADHPKSSKLVNESDRGRLLHFFANHELLATELMALALLKFPDAPKSFRRGLFETLKDEQAHTRIYLRRMKQCGIEFGELPLSDYFWKSVSTMEDPLDYVTRLSLTFEQANLDYSREYGKIFKELGDTQTANILDKIYRDEIGHVGFGLRWFRKWKENGKSDWEVFRERLSFPLSPSRAKGNVFNERGRNQAGLDENFIDSLKLFSQSRGRTPTVFYFNPEAESYASRNRFDTEHSSQASFLRSDLGFLPAYLSRQGDILLLPQKPNDAFLSYLQNAGFTIPEIVVRPDSSAANAKLLGRKLGKLQPWAWSPDSLAYLEPYFPELTRKPSVSTLWNDKRRNFYSKGYWANWTRENQNFATSQDWLAPANSYGATVTSLREIADLRRELARFGYKNIVCKAPFGTAANGMRCLMESDTVSGSIEAWIEATLESQGSLQVEPWLDRVFDFSVQFDKTKSSLKRIAFTRLINNSRGQFRGILAAAFDKGLDSELLRFAMRRENGTPRIFSYFERTLAPQLAKTLEEADFTGPFGIDAFVYRDPSGELRLKPIVELNPRVTMGRVAHELSTHCASRSIAYFEIVNRSELKRRDANDFVSYARSLESQFPIQSGEDLPRKIRNGSLAVSDSAQAKRFLPILHVRETYDELGPFIGF